jgi:hypothetical protein
MKRTACEEAADQLYQGSDLCKRLRAEARELKRLRTLIVDSLKPFAGDKRSVLPWKARMESEAARIEKARKK